MVNELPIQQLTLKWTIANGSMTFGLARTCNAFSLELFVKSEWNRKKSVLPEVYMLPTVIQSEKSAARLSQIKTNWSQLFAATRPSGEATTEAQRQLLLNYSGAMYRYLVGAVRNEDTASDLAQDFAVRFLRGDFRAVTPEKGRFRDFLKRTLSNLVNDHFRKHKTEQNRLQTAAKNEALISETTADTFDQDWVIEILRRTWEALKQHQQDSSTAYYAVLRARAESPEMNSRQLCEVLAVELSHQTVNEAWIRQNLSRARRLFATLLRAEVAGTLKDSRPEIVDEELMALGLLKYCQ